ncbi:MAG: hypothetical protein KF726_13140 [Anaerolineae bacterium]|nr:hypothetical protein [Anaerolineae bacterium]
MVHSRSFRVSAILVLAGLLLAGCDTPTPTPTPSRTPLPTLPPPTPVVVTLAAPPATLAPSWTPVPTRTNAPTRTLAPSATVTAIPATSSAAPALAVTVGVIKDNEVYLAVSAAELERELAVDRGSAFISNSVGTDPKVSLSGNVVRLEAVFNNYTTEGIRAEVEFALRYSGVLVRPNVARYLSVRGTVLTPTHLSAIRDLLDKTLNRLLAAQLEQAAPGSASATITQVLIQENRIIVKLRLTYPPTLTPTDTETPAPTETTTATEPAATEEATASS